jgi:20S proteasome alpha/beta subunit
MKSDVVVMVKPEAIDAVIQSIGGVNVEGQGYVQGDTLEFLRAEQSEGGMSRGNAIESVADAIKSAAQDKDKRQAIMTTIIAQYNAGNIIVEPNDWAVRFMTAESINKVFG